MKNAQSVRADTIMCPIFIINIDRKGLNRLRITETVKTIFSRAKT